MENAWLGVGGPVPPAASAGTSSVFSSQHISDKLRFESVLALAERMIIPLKSMLPTANDILQAELEDLGAVLLKHLKSCEGKSPVFQHAGLNREYFIAIMERRNVGLGPLPSKDPEYGSKQPEVTQAFVEAWDWLVREGLLIRNHQQPAVMVLDLQKRTDVAAKTTPPRPRGRENNGS